ncbi:hypothetical protein TrLO_g11550 [Triparma laevis f. longispina]|uniref:RanBD1 domain-containing protein n=1 Tax=Triparma laevis f. longispina TaxID=1714387 RepID=A0A9W7F9K9_9STRA|nr:hypothetical protein TrLO_g11550 [Triparma laevis f. longispina]
MAKRGNANAQQRREEYEHENDREAEDPGEGFNKASVDILKKRRIISISAKKKNVRGNAGAVPSGGGVFGNVNLQAKSSNPFGGVNLQVNNNGSKPSASASSLNPFGAVKQNSFSAPAPAQLPVWSAPKPAPAAPSSSSESKLERLNASFIKWLQRQRIENPASDYSAGIQDYIKYASLALNESNPKPKSALAPAPVPPPAPAPAPVPSFNFNSGAKSSPAKAPAPAPAPAPSFNFNSGASQLPTAPAPAPAPAAFSGFNFGGGSSIAPAPALTSAPSFSFSGGATTAPAPANANANASAPPAEDGDSFPVEKPAELEKEENTEEDLLLEVKAKYYRLKTGEGWKDRGVGNAKLYRHKTTSKCRLVMRNSIGKVGLNTSINAASQKFEKLGGKQSSCKFIIQDDEGMAQIMLKVKPENLDKLHSTLEAMK